MRFTVLAMLSLLFLPPALQTIVSPLQAIYNQPLPPSTGSFAAYPGSAPLPSSTIDTSQLTHSEWYTAALQYIRQAAQPHPHQPSTNYRALSTVLAVDSLLEGPGQPESDFGAAVASAGDVNNDGYSDVLIGAPLYDSVYENEGRVWLYYGSVNGLPVVPDLTLSYHSNVDGNEHFGCSVASAGDVNKDGYSDIIIGSNFASDDGYELALGRVLLYYGSATGIHATADKILKSQTGFAFFGNSVAGAGDINGDGYSDIIVGAPGYGYLIQPLGATGRVFIYYGSATGLPDTASTYLEGNQRGGAFGHIVASAGDINGDGYSDVVVNSPGYYIYDWNGEGAVFVYLGSTSGLVTTYANLFTDSKVYGGTGFGSSLAGGNDLNGDGYADLVVNQPHDLYLAEGNPYGPLHSRSRLLMYYGSAVGFAAAPVIIDHSSIPGLNAGSSINNAGDVNGDGYADIIVAGSQYDSATSTSTGRLLLYHGSPAGLSATAFDMIDSAAREPGMMVACLGDIDGDGYSDLIAGAPTYGPNAGRAYVYHGSPDSLRDTPPGTKLESPSITIAGFGKSLSYAGDINGDGYADVVIGDPNAIKGSNNYEGMAYVYYGSPNGLPAIPKDTLQVNQPNCKFGWSVAGAGDINGDGYADLAISAINYNQTEGRIFLYYGSPSGLVKAPAFLSGGKTHTWLGYSVAGAGDVNGDGYDDLLVSAYNDIVTIDTGKVFVYYGSSGGLPPTPSLVLQGVNETGLTGFGRSLGSAGDVNGDGFADVIVGAWTNNNNFNGRAFVYLGAAAGLSPVAATILGNGGVTALPGSYVAGAGDINGDGFSDVLVSADFRESYTSTSNVLIFMGSPAGIGTAPSGAITSTITDLHLSNALGGGDINSDGYADVLVTTDENFSRGSVLVYQGTATGLSPTPDTLRNRTDEFASFFGYSASAAGDVNGDGYPDVLTGELFGGMASFGAVYLYYGNSKKNYRNNIRLYNTDLSSPLNQANLAADKIGLGLFAKSPLGRQKARLVWETRSAGTPFSGSPITNSTDRSGRQSTFTNLGLTGTELKNLIPKTGNTTRVRARVEYDHSTAVTGQHYGPWRYALDEGRSRVNNAPDPLAILRFTAEKQHKDVLLKWTTPAYKAGIYYTVERSGNGNHYIELFKTPSRRGHTDYRWLDEHPEKGKNYYRIKSSDGYQQKYSSVELVEFERPRTCIVYPNPVCAGQPLYIRLSPAAGNILIQLSDMRGKIVLKQPFTTDNEWFTIKTPLVPSGLYLLTIKMEGETINRPVLILKR